MHGKSVSEQRVSRLFSGLNRHGAKEFSAKPTSFYVGLASLSNAKHCIVVSFCAISRSGGESHDCCLSVSSDVILVCLVGDCGFGSGHDFPQIRCSDITWFIVFTYQAMLCAGGLYIFRNMAVRLRVCFFVQLKLSHFEWLSGT